MNVIGFACVNSHCDSTTEILGIGNRQYYFFFCRFFFFFGVPEIPVKDMSI